MVVAGFSRVDGVVHCDAVPLDRIAERVGTPAYIYSAQSIVAQYRRLDDALEGIPHRLHYSVKANFSLAVLALLRTLGAGVDIVSGGELYRAVNAGYKGGDVVFSGVGKTEREIEEAISANVLLINVESEQELDLIDKVARRIGTGVTAQVALRVNPEVTVDTPHSYTRTGEKGIKFGIPHDEVVHVARKALAMKGIRLCGLDMHVGSQISQFTPYQLGMKRLVELVAELRESGARDLKYLDIGGGLAVTYDTENSVDVEQFGKVVRDTVAGTGLTILLEPGRFLVGNAGAIVTRVLYRKHSGGKNFVITDAGMNDLLRPSHYNAYHRIEAVKGKAGSKKITADIVGPICETGDFFALDREIEDVDQGDLLVVYSAGAYGFVMASNYNSRPRACEVLVDGNKFGVINTREDYPSLIRNECATPKWVDSNEGVS